MSEEKEIKIALAMICKGTDEEAELLDRCLDNVQPYVDGIFVVNTFKKGGMVNTKVRDVVADHGGWSVNFEWINDFSAARNFSFEQVPEEYDYIMWCDADDMFRGMEKLRPTIEDNPNVDAFAMWYMYEFDDNKQPIVIHKKTMVIRNDGCSNWKGALHEDLIPNRSLEVKLIEGIDRMHFPNEGHQIEVAKRNVEISEQEAKRNPEDARNLFNLGNSYIGNGQFAEAEKTMQQFIEKTGSDDEKYIAFLRLAAMKNALGNVSGAMTTLQIAVGMKPEFPDAYNQLGYLCFDNGQLENAEKYLLQGLQTFLKNPPYHDIIVYNPRDYDYNPMFALSKVYFKINRPDLALPMLKGCLALNKEDKKLQELIVEMEAETARLEAVLLIAKELSTETDKEKIKARLDEVPVDLRSHPALTSIRNQNFIKTESSGKDITYYCGLTTHEWNPEMAKTKGIGGSEEAVINLSKEWVKMGYNVTVYSNCGPEAMVCDGVTYRPFWEYNYRDKTDYTIVWRHPKLLDYDLNGKVFVDLHDVISEGEFNKKRLAKIDRIFVKTKFHRSLFPNIPDEKFAVIPNGIDFKLFEDSTIEKDRYLLVNTSSPDRSLDVLPKLFKEVKKQIPQARLKWAYGWEIFDNSFSNDKERMTWKDKVVKEMEEAGIENMGRLSQAECAKLYLEGNILAYPTEFAEIDCITVKKAQACGCMPITTNFGALDESVQFGVKIHSNKTKDNWSRPHQAAFGIEDEEAQKQWVDAVVKQLKQPIMVKERQGMQFWTQIFAWPKIATKWSDILK